MLGEHGVYSTSKVGTEYVKVCKFDDQGLAHTRERGGIMKRLGGLLWVSNDWEWRNERPMRTEW